MKGKFKKATCLLLIFMVLLTVDLVPPGRSDTVWAANNSCKIHFLTLADNTDAILLECNGKFGMVDSGEDNDYPNGSQPDYPSRPGIVKGNGFEQDVIAYLQAAGVTKDNFEFYIGTHPHSDHIGSADEIIYAFHPKRVYIEAYSDKDVTDSTRLWDNLYVYDHMVKAAQDTGATLIQSFNTNAPLYPETVTVSGSIIMNKDAEVPPESGDNTNPDDSSSVPPADTDETLPPAQDNDTDSQDTDTAPQDMDKEMQNTGTAPQDIDKEAQDTDSAPQGTDTKSQDTDSVSQDNDKKMQDTDSVSQNIGKEGPDTDSVPKSNDQESQDTDTASQDIDKQSQDTNAASQDADTASPDTDSAAQDGSTDGTTILPSRIEVTLSYVTSDPETKLPADVTVEAQEVPGKEGIWTYSFTGIRKYDDTKTPFTYKMSPKAEGYTFAPAEEENIFDFVCSTENPSTPESASILPEDTLQFFSVYQEESGTTDEPLDPQDDGSSDDLTVEDIPPSDQVDPDHPDDPNNAYGDTYAAPAQSGIFDGKTVGSVSTPVFMLGGKNGMKLEIMNYGVKRPQPDANYYSLGVKVTSMTTKKTAFLAGDINNYIGAETALAKRLGHVNVLKLGHHGFYGSNTYNYLKALSPDIAIMTGKYNYVSNSSVDNNIGTLDSLLKLGQSGTALYPTAWYAPYIKAIVINLDKGLSNNIPKGKEFIASAEGSSPYRHIYYYDGFPKKTNGWKKDSKGNWYYFENSYNASTNKWLQNASGQWSYLKDDGTMAVGWVLANGKWYYTDSNGFMTTGWQKVNGKWYYMDSNGQMQTGRKNIGKYYYYFDTSTGAMAQDQYVNGYYYDSSGKWIPNFKDGNWQHNATGYWYQFGNGTYPTSCWLQIHGEWYYFNASGYIVTGWMKQGNTWYYFNGDGVMCTGWYWVNGIWYYSDTSGKMLTGLQTINGKKYYFNSSGAMATGWVYLNKSWYYFTENGANTGWYTVGNIWYYSNSAGKMQTGWIKSNGRYYYTSGSGAMLTGWIYVDKKWYYLDNSGAMLTGWYKVNGIWYYSNASGEMLTGLHTLGQSKYYLAGNGAMATGWVYTGNKWYYFNSNGAAAIGWYKINNVWYCSNSAGVMQTGWLKQGNAKYYMYGNGAMATGWAALGNKWYYFTDSGAVARGWFKVNNTWYYSDSSGVMQTGWLEQGNTRYYLYGNGSMATGWAALGNKWYYFTDSGAVVRGWFKINNTWYYSNSSGIMQTGWLKQGSTRYYLYGDGSMATGWLLDGNKWFYMNSLGAMTTGWQKVNGTWYYLNPSNGVMYANAWTPDGYFVNGSGAWTGQQR